jgi:hypothetical protein
LTAHGQSFSLSPNSGAVPESTLTKGKDKKVGISTRRFKQLALLCGLGATGILAACASSPESSGGAGGSSASGGSMGSGGSSARGGSTSSGGSSASGGSTGSGGSNATGGTLASGGATSSGGSSGGPVTLFDFAAGDQGWVFNTYQATATNGQIVSPYNLAAPGVLPDAGVALPTIAADSTVGDPPGSLKIVVTFTGYAQQVNPNYNWATPQDWTNKVVSVRVKVDPAVPATFTGGGIQLDRRHQPGPHQHRSIHGPTLIGQHAFRD